MSAIKLFCGFAAAGSALFMPAAGLAGSSGRTADLELPLLLEDQDDPDIVRDIYDGAHDDGTIAAQTQQTRMTVPVWFGDKGPYPFMIDTGSETTVLSTELALELGLAGDGWHAMAGSVDRTNVERVEMPAVTIGKHVLPPSHAILLAKKHIGAAGILGIDTLREQRVVFDFTKKKVAFSKSPSNRVSRWSAVNRGSDVQFELVVDAEGKAERMVLAEASVDGVPVKVIVDTGSNITVGNSALLNKLRRPRTIGTTAIFDVTGAGVARDVIVTDFMRLGSFRLARGAIIINDSPAFEELGLTEEPAILLGMNHLRSFRRISVDFARGEVSFDLRS